MYSFRCLTNCIIKLERKDFMLKKYLKRNVIAAVTALCVLGMTACGGGKEGKETDNQIGRAHV